MTPDKYLILIFSDDARAWIVTKGGVPLVETDIRPVDLNKEYTQRLEDFPQRDFPGKGVYFYRLSDRSLTRAPQPALSWTEVLAAVREQPNA